MTTQRKGRGAVPTWLCLAIFLLASCANDSDEASPPGKGKESLSSAGTPAVSPDPSASGEAQTGTFTVDGNELLLDCAGKGETTMVFEVGEGAPYRALSGIG